MQNERKFCSKIDYLALVKEIHFFSHREARLSWKLWNKTVFLCRQKGKKKERETIYIYTRAHSIPSEHQKNPLPLNRILQGHHCHFLPVQSPRQLK